METEDSGGGSAPLGKLTAAQIGKGQKVLDKIEAALKKKGWWRVTDLKCLAGADLDDLSSQYFSLIPHDFGGDLEHVSRPSEVASGLLLSTLQISWSSRRSKETLVPVRGIQL